MNITLKNNRGKKSEFAKQALIRYVQDMHLKVGDKLPGNGQLRQQLDVSATTIFRAIQELRDEDIFEVRDKVGTFIKSEIVSTKIGRSIGLLLPYDSYPSSFICLLSLLIQYALMEQGCLPVPFLRGEIDEFKNAGLETIPGLERALLDEKLDGVIDLCDIKIPSNDHRFDHIPFVLVGFSKEERCGVSLDLLGFVAAAMSKAAHLGFQRPGLVAFAGDYAKSVSIPFFQRMVTECGFAPQNKGNVFTATTSLRGRCWVPYLREMASEARPDVLISIDEFVANDLLTALRLSRDSDLKDYRPALIVCSKAELPMTLAAEWVIYYEVSLTKLAQDATDYLLKRLRGETKSTRMEYLPFIEKSNQEFFGTIDLNGIEKSLEKQTT